MQNTIVSKHRERIALVGGGGGVYRIAHFLKNIRPNIATVQTVFDDGGHSARLRLDHGVLPPGDIRQAILALSDESSQPLLRQLLAFRFPQKGSDAGAVPSGGENMGNMMLTALTKITGSLPAAIEEMCRIFRVSGTVLPVSLDNAHLAVRLSDGTVLKSEGVIDTRPKADPRKIELAWLEPKAHIYTAAYRALVEADKIVFCPGDFWTSLIPNLLVEGFKDALKESKAKKILVTNIMTKKAETDGYDTAKFAEKLCGYAGLDALDFTLVNTSAVPSDILERYKLEFAHPVAVVQTDRAGQCIAGEFADFEGGVIRHHQRVVSTIAEL